MSDTAVLPNENRTQLISKCDDLVAEIANEGESAETRVRLANLHLRLEEREEAIMSFQIALRLRPNTPAILAKLKQICTEEEFANLKLPEKIEPFWRDIPKLFRYPLAGSGVYLLIGGTIFITVIHFIVSLPTIFFYATTMLAVFLAGYLSSYFISIMRSSAQGKNEPPDWPDATGIVGKTFRSLFVVSFPMVVAFFPAVAYFIYSIFYQTPFSILVGLIVAGGIYYPMALIASAITGAPLNSANFIGIIGSILKVRKEYFIAELMLAFFSGISIAAYFMVGIATQAMAGAFIAGFAVQFVNLYFMMIFAHILGLLYRQCKSRINA